MFWECCAIFAFLGLAGGISSSQNDSWHIFITLMTGVCTYVLALMIQLSCVRVCLIMEERHHLRGRYNNQLKQLLFSAWNVNISTICVFTFSIVVIVTCWNKYGNPCLLIHDLGPYSSIAIVIAASLICHLIKAEKSSLLNSINLEQMEGMDYGSGMAYNFFYGYLNIILPDSGGGDKGLTERIEDYISQQKLNDNNFPVKKLFILIPASTFIPRKLDDVSSNGWLESSGSLSECVRHRAGVVDRVYKNSVYRIKNPNSSDEPLYVVAEGATPLQTLYDAVSHNGDHQEFYRKHLKEIISMFYKTLRRIIKMDRGCRDLCELIYYIDTDKHGNRCVNVAKLIQKRVQKLQNMGRR